MHERVPTIHTCSASDTWQSHSPTSTEPLPTRSIWKRSGVVRSSAFKVTDLCSHLPHRLMHSFARFVGGCTGEAQFVKAHEVLLAHYPRVNLPPSQRKIRLGVGTAVGELCFYNSTFEIVGKPCNDGREAATLSKPSCTHNPTT